MIERVRNEGMMEVVRPYSDYRKDKEMLCAHIDAGLNEWFLAKRTGEGMYEVTVFFRNGASVLGPYVRKAGSALEAIVAEGNSRTKGDKVELMIDASPDWLTKLMAEG